MIPCGSTNVNIRSAQEIRSWTGFNTRSVKNSDVLRLCRLMCGKAPPFR